MGYRLVKGEYALFYEGDRFVGSSPDGDSMWFKPNDPSHLEDIAGRDADLNKGGFAQLRFEGIDALELHYPGHKHQMPLHAVGARDVLLGDIGFSNIVYAPNDDIPRTVRDAQPAALKGYILTRTVDPFGRPVAFVYTGSAPETDGSDVFLETGRLDRSLNARLMAAGMVYPAYYTARDNEGGLPTDLRDRLTELSLDAWFANRGLWPDDESRANPSIPNVDVLQTRAIWPKLYRRLVKYFDDGHSGLADFEDWLRDSDKDDQVVLPTQELGNLHDTFEVDGNRIDMLYWPEELMVIPG